MNRSAILTSNIAGTAMRDVLLVNDADAAGQEENSGQSRTCRRPSPHLLSRPHSLQTRDVFSLGLGEAEANLLESNCYPRHDIRH